MKIWITYNSAWGLQCGGLERVWVHFRMPEWIHRWRDAAEDDQPFYNLSDMNGRLEQGWKDHPQYGLTHISFGKLFGYGDTGGSESILAKYVWQKICDHFKGYEFTEWDKAPVSPKDFLLELDINITMKAL